MKNLISWASVPSSDFDRAVKFYSTMTGKEFKVQGEGEKRMATCLSEMDFKNGVVGFGVTGDTTIKPGATGSRLYIICDDMEGWLSRVESAGGKVLTPKSEMGEMGFWALIEDSEGNHVGLHSEE
ncbi:MAG: uncharacterized protein QG568_262 [Patescibacteria group bacterium]|nr:uncharacterized protein [Patescibacteria group bacterium]